MEILSLSTGRFFPEEDDQFVERIRAAVEEEERQAAAAQNTSAAATAILNAEEARNAAAGVGKLYDLSGSQEIGEAVPSTASSNLEEPAEKQLLQHTFDDLKNGSSMAIERNPEAASKRKQTDLPKGYDGLPSEFYQYYFGSSFDMGTLVEVRYCGELQSCKSFFRQLLVSVSAYSGLER
jgi:hypothetical protein